jgi:hypothetical protein
VYSARKRRRLANSERKPRRWIVRKPYFSRGVRCSVDIIERGMDDT